jgi:glucose uptake protein GlcU
MDSITNFFSNFVIGQDYINGFVLIGLIVVNIFLGSMDAWINKQFDKEKFIKGIKKGFGITIATLITYNLGQLVPNLLVITSNDVDVNIPTAVGLAITAGVAWYAKEVVVKIKNAIGAKV